jgi:hypothetical protein
MPEETKKASEELVNVGETVGADIDFDDKGEPVKQEEVVEETIEVEQVPAEDKSFENERETKLKKPEDKDELQDYSDGVQKRIAKLTRKMREAERQREEAVQFAQAAKLDKDRMESKLSNLDKSYVKEFESRVTTNMDAARHASRLGALKKLNEEAPKQERPVYQAPTPRRQQTDPKAEAWARDNSWFGSDSAMTHTAFDLHKTLVEQEGYDPQSDEYYEEVDSRIRLEFPHKFDKIDSSTTERTKPVQNVASARRSSSTGRKNKTVKLSPSQVAIAKRLGVPLEDYAKQLKITEGA